MASRCSNPIFAAAFASIVVLPVAGVPAQAPDRARTEALARRTAERLQALQREADRLASEEGTLLNQLRKLEVDRQVKAEQLRQVDAEAAQIQGELDAATRHVEELQASDAAARPELRSRLVEMYKLGKASYARIVLAAPDLRRMGQASRTVAVLARLDRERLAAQRRRLAELQATRATLEERQRRVAVARAAAERAQVAAAHAAQAQTDLIRDIDRRRDLNAQLSGELQSAQQKLQVALRDATAADVPPLPLRAFRGDLDWPAAGDIRQRFGRPAATPGSPSNGIELGTDEGARVTAVHEGAVAFAGTFSGFGNLVILEHGPQTFSVYGDLLDLAVTKGAKVDRGQPIGSAGPLPSGGTGLYFELRVDGRLVDPLEWLKRK